MNFSIRPCLIGLIFILLFIPGSSALLVDTIRFEQTPWLVAGSPESVTIALRALNGTNPVSSSSVTFRVENPDMGTIIPTTTITNLAGQASATFYPKTKSGIAWIKVRVNHSAPDIGYKEQLFGQRIDHTGPKYVLNPQVISPAAVDEDVNIIVQFQDRYGNILDDKRFPEKFFVKFDASGSEGYFDGNPLQHVIVKDTSVDDPITGHEETTVRFHLPTLAGQNYLRISEISTTDVYPNSTFLVIEGVGTVPHHIDMKIEDNDPETPISYQTYADPFHYFKIIYTVYDRFGNPVPKVNILWQTDAGDDYPPIPTNYAGDVYLEYSKDYPQFVTMTASVQQSDVFRIDNVEFLQREAMAFAITGIPQLMASRDVEGRWYDYANITVKVVDYFGQPIADEMVKVYIDYSSLKNSTYLTWLPNLSVGSSETGSVDVKTNENGIANVRFYPGAFPTNRKDLGFVDTADGSVIVRAEWKESKRSVEMSYKNYPYLRAIASIDTDRCVVNETHNETLNYTLTLIGDGFLWGGSADVLLLEDRSETMLWGPTFGKYTTPDEMDRMWAAVKASKIFIGCLTETLPGSRISIASYGDQVSPVNLGSDKTQRKWIGDDNKNDIVECYEEPRSCYKGDEIDSYDFWSMHLNLSELDQASSIEESTIILDRLTPYNDGVRHDDGSPENQYAAPIRKGLYESIVYLKQKGSSSSTKAIVGLMDTSWTWYGDPLAQQSGSTMTDPWREASAGTSKWYPFDGTDYKCSIYTQCPPIGNPSTWDRNNGINNWQNMSLFARDNNITLWMVFYNGQYDANTFKKLQTLCDATGGQAFYAATSQELIDALQIIAHKIHGMASVNTSVSLDFTKINVTYADLGEEVRDGWEVFNYSYLYGKSTHIEKKNGTGVPYTPPYPIDQDDTPNWTTNHTFSWEVGNMSLKDNWTVQFMMEVLVPGNIVLFGPESNIMADNPDDNFPPQNISLPHTWISCYENWTVPEIRQEILDIIHVEPDNPHATFNLSRNGVEVIWNLSYTNYTGNRTIKQEIFFEFSPYKDVWTNDWIQFDTIVKNASKEEINGTYHSFLDTTSHQGYVRIMIFAYEDFVGGAWDKEIAEPADVVVCEKCIQIY